MEYEEGWRLLFDGESLTGWHDFQQDGINGPWKIEDNSIVVQGEKSDYRGCLVTNEQ